MTLRRETMAEQGVELLRTQMLTGVLRPGDTVTEEAMAREIGISRPTMREVLSKLVAEGLLTRNPNTRVLHVTRLSAQEIREIYVARRLLELGGVDAVPSAAPDALVPLERATADLITAVTAKDPVEVARADFACHLATVNIIGSPDLVETYARILTKLELAMAEGMRSSSELKVALDVHVEFLSLLQAGKVSEARDQLSARLTAAEAEQLEIIEGRRA